LEDNPNAGRMVPEISNPDIRELIFQKYRVVYKLKGKQIEILTVFEGHKLLQID
jgi:plasmid stabilization system protein ParE